jgi:hypothetical protein
LFCKHFIFNKASPEHGGTDWEMGCHGGWCVLGLDYPDQKEFVEKLTGTCENWENRNC